jgi:hypothetical protein
MRLEKLTVDDVKDEQDFRLEDEATEDSTEQLNPNNSHVRKVDIYAKYVNNSKHHKLAQHKGV